MSAYDSVTPEDEFLQSLEESLRTEYSSHMMSNFISDLIVAINNLDDDVQDGFLFDEDFRFKSSFPETNTIDDFTQRHILSHRIATTSQLNVQNLSVDMFAEYQDDKEATIADSDCSEEMNVDEHSNVLEFQSDLDAVGDHSSCSDIFADEVEVMDSDSDCPNSINKHPNVGQHQSDPVTNLDESKSSVISYSHHHCNVAEQRDVKELQNDEVIEQGEDHSNESLNVNTENTFSKYEECSVVNIITKQNSLQQAPVTGGVGGIGNHRLSKSFDVLIGVPVRTTSRAIDESTNNELNENLGTIERPTFQKPPNETTGQGFSNNDTRFPVFSPVRSINTGTFARNTSCTSPQSDCDLSKTVCEEFETFNNFSQRMQGSFSEASIFRGFSPVRPLSNRVCSRSSSWVDSDVNTTFCEEYEAANNFTPLSPNCLSQSSSRRSSSNGGPIRKRTGISRRESDLDTTFCEEYESANNFFGDRNATQATNINFAEAYLQCFLGSQDQNGKVKLQPLSDGRTRTIVSKRRIAMILYVISFVYNLLINNKTCTKREIYYSDPSFTQNQSEVDCSVKDVCLILDASPWEIGILSSSKGLIAGSIKLTLNDDTIFDVRNIDGGVLLPQHTATIKKVETLAKFVLLVEKHTIYEKLLTDNFLTRLNPCILITGKGYPDTNTRHILKKIWDDCKCPIYALIDADPHGIEIMLSYRHGSMNMSYCDLAIPSIRWIGVFPSEIKKHKLESLQMTNGDCIRLDSMIKRPYISKEILSELLVLKTTLRKTEAEALMSSQVVDWIDSYLRNKIQSEQYI